MLFYCFIRPNSELRLLRVGDILLDEWKVLIRADVSKNKKQEYVTIPKAFRPALSDLKRRNPGEMLFPGKHDCTKPMGCNTMYERHRKILKQLGFSSDYKLYSWKHTGAVMAVKAGIPVKELQIQLRHHSLEMVDRYLRQMGVWDLVNLEESLEVP